MKKRGWSMFVPFLGWEIDKSAKAHVFKSWQVYRAVELDTCEYLSNVGTKSLGGIYGGEQSEFLIKSNFENGFVFNTNIYHLEKLVEKIFNKK